MAKVRIELDIPDYKIKYCDDVWNGSRCKFLESFNYGFSQRCILSNKSINKTKNDGNKICRPYGCRCLAKYHNINNDSK